METHRRDFLKAAGTAGAFAAAGTTLGGSGGASAAPAPARSGPKGMARGLTLLTMRQNGEYRLGVKTDHGILDVKAAAGLLHLPAPATMDDLLQNEDGPNLNALVDAALKAASAKKAFLQEDAIEYGPVVTRPEKIVCIGLNYKHHAKEINQPIPKQPILFNKFNNTLNAHKGKIKLPVDVATKFDYETELVIVIGKETRNVSEADAGSYIAGFATGNDFSARDLQLETGGQWMIGKTPDQFAPLGPYLVTADQVDGDNLALQTWVNGELRQNSNTNDMIFGSKTLVSFISRHMTLRGGDIIYTGTPEGVIQGKPVDKRIWLKPGDKVVSSLEKLGKLEFELT
jgi:2-keto-4-pentenoate hydratase/2-oxohepta-3-ene-1,7-dioic acid hydratase in catechol pathway